MVSQKSQGSHEITHKTPLKENSQRNRRKDTVWKLESTVDVAQFLADGQVLHCISDLHQNRQLKAVDVCSGLTHS